MNSDLSTAFSIDDDVSFIYNKIRKNDIYAYEPDEHNNKHEVLNDTHEIIDVTTEKKYSYGIGAIYIILILVVGNALLTNITTYKKKVIEDTFLDNYKNIADEMIRIKHENNLMSEKLLNIELDLNRKKKVQERYDEYHSRRNYMNYKYGTQMIQEKTSESCNMESNVIATDLLTPSYMNDDTLTWECLHDGYCALGIHFDSMLMIDRIVYEYGRVEQNIERIKVYYEIDGDMVLHNDHFCSGDDYEVVDLIKDMKVENIEVHLYPKRKNVKCIKLNNLIINAV